MGVLWRDTPSWSVVDEVSEASGRDVAGLLLDADAATLQQTRNAQVAAFALGLVVLDAARRAGWSWDVAAGHSLGEYTALVAAGVLSRADAARLVAARAEAMGAAADAAPGTMAAIVALDASTVAACCEKAGGGVWVANDNAPGQIVVAGTAEGVAAAGAAARAEGGKVLPLAVGGAFHTPLMASAQADLDTALRAAPFGPAAIPVVANVDAVEHLDGWEGLLSAQLCQPVRWRELTLRLAGLGVERVVELGPGAVLSGMIKRTAPELDRVTVAGPSDLGPPAQRP